MNRFFVAVFICESGHPDPDAVNGAMLGALTHRYDSVVAGLARQMQLDLVKGELGRYLVTSAQLPPLWQFAQSLRNAVASYNQKQRDLDRHLEMRLLLHHLPKAEAEEIQTLCLRVVQHIAAGSLAVTEELNNELSRQGQPVYGIALSLSADSFRFGKILTITDAVPQNEEMVTPGIFSTAPVQESPAAEKHRNLFDFSQADASDERQTRSNLPRVVRAEQEEILDLAAYGDPSSTPQPKLEVIRRPLNKRTSQRLSLEHRRGWRLEIMHVVIMAALIPLIMVSAWISWRNSLPKPVVGQINHAELDALTEATKRLKNENPNVAGTPPPGQINEGTLEIYVTPRRADVYLDNQLVGRQTPLRIRKVRFEDHLLKVRAPGFNEYFQMFNLDESHRVFRVKLEKRR